LTDIAYRGTHYADQEKTRDGPEDDIDVDPPADGHIVYDHYGGVQEQRQVDRD